VLAAHVGTFCEAFTFRGDGSLDTGERGERRRKGGMPMRRVILAVVAVFLAWSLMDFVIHGAILASSYAATPSLWRPMNEMKMPVMYLSVLIAALSLCTFCFSPVEAFRLDCGMASCSASVPECRWATGAIQ
jgi:hypothetical protein